MYKILKYPLNGGLVGMSILSVKDLSLTDAKQRLKTLQVNTIKAGNEALWTNREHTRLEVNQLDVNRCYEYRIEKQD